MPLLESLYARLPEPLQDLAVTLQGAVYRRQRYGAAFREEYELLKATDRASPLQLELLQVARLRRLLRHAAGTVSFYRSRIPSRTWDHLRAGDWAAFEELPITEKQSLRDQPQAFYSGGRANRSWISWTTSGTTGTPLQLFYDERAVGRQYAYVERYREVAGVSRLLRRAQFTGKMISPGEHNRRHWRRDWTNNTLLLSSVHLNADTMPQYLAALAEFRPAFLTGYPSAIALLAQNILRYPSRRVVIPAILTSAETLVDEQRAAIEAAFGAKVYDQYGQSEMQSFWSECRYRRMHAHPLFGVTEIVRPDGSACRPGEVGDVVLTGLINEAMPLIRYRVGDRAAWSGEERCPCGRSMPIIEAIEGRREDYLYSRQRGWVGRMDPALKGITGILECQFIQESIDSIRVLLVPEAGFNDLDRMQMEKNLHDRLGSEMEIEFEFLRQIPRGPNGKFRAVVSRLPRELQSQSEIVPTKQSL